MKNLNKFLTMAAIAMTSLSAGAISVTFNVNVGDAVKMKVSGYSGGNKEYTLAEGNTTLDLEEYDYIEAEGIDPYVLKSVTNAAGTPEYLSVGIWYKSVYETDEGQTYNLTVANKDDLYTASFNMNVDDPTFVEGRFNSGRIVKPNAGENIVKYDPDAENRITIRSTNWDKPLYNVTLDGVDVEAYYGSYEVAITQGCTVDVAAIIPDGARVSPENKIRIVEGWQRRGNIVSMTGDGVNDAPALKKADIGVAMGITGTEVSKDAAAMILADDNFATIIKAVANGRNVYRNIKNAVLYLLSGNTAAIFAVLYTSLMALPVPFAPVQLLFINLLTDSLPALAIGMEPADEGLLKEKPRDPKEGLMTKDFMIQMAAQGVLIAAVVITAFYLGLRSSTAMASTMAFSTLTLARLFHGFNCRGKKSIFKLGFGTNPYSLYAFGAGALLLGLVIFIPGLHRLFQVQSMPVVSLLQVAVLAFIPTLMIQMKRLICKK